MGNFDGIHIGHKSLIEMARPNNINQKLGVLTFDPHPREFFAPSHRTFKLMNKKAKVYALKRLSVDLMIEIPFTRSLSLLDAETFSKKILGEDLKLKHVVVGSDFRFGFKRLGDTEALVRYGKKYGFEVTVAPIISYDKLEVSSTAIRQYLSKGDVKTAAKMLGHYYYVLDTVIKGDQRGRELGFPTINLPVDNLHLPKFGIYSAMAEVLDGKHKGNYKAIVSLGERPTFGLNKANFEAHLLDFSGDVYGVDVIVELIEFQRPELKFKNSNDLIKQMEKDCMLARQILVCNGK